MTEAVVARALLAVGKNGVGLAAFLEALFRLRIAGVAIGVVLQRQLAIGALELLVAGRAGDAQNLVIVAFSVAGQKCLPLSRARGLSLAETNHSKSSQ